MRIKTETKKHIRGITRFFNDFNKNLAKSAGINNTVPIDIEPGNSVIMPAYAHDYGNYVARYGMGNCQIQFIMKLDGRIDFDKLRRAVRLSIDAEPVLGCRFVEHNPPYWERLQDIDKIEFCTIEETEDTDKAIHSFLKSRLDMDHDPMVKIMLIRSSLCDTMVIKLNHTCTDGGGTKDFVFLLAEIYSSIEGENDGYVPKPSVRSRKDHEKVFRTLGIEHPESDTSIAEAPRTVWPFPWSTGTRKDITPFVICQLSDDQLGALTSYARKMGATINDLLVTAFYRSMFKLTRPPYGVPMDIGLTIDLRRYLPDNKAEAIRNFSGGIILRLARILHEPFEGTLSRVISMMNRRKSQNPGYQCATGAERAEKLNFYQFLSFSKFMARISEATSQNCFYCAPGLSNIGIISKSLIKFGELNVKEAYFIPPVVRAPGLLLVASSYNGIMTLAAGYYEGSIKELYLAKLLNKIKSELIDNCK